MTGFAVIVRAELLKLRTTRMWWGLLVLAVVLTVLYAVLIASFAGRSVGGAPPTTPGLDDPATLRTIYGVALSSSYVIPLVIGVLGMAGEYRHKTMTPTLLAVPRRGRLVAAKVVTYALVGLAMGVVLSATAMLAGGVTVVLRGYPLGLGADGVPRTLVLAVLGCGIWAVFGLGLGTLVRNQVAAIVIALASQLLVEQLLILGLNALPYGGNIAQFLPSSAASAMISGAGGAGGLTIQVLSWWAGALVLTGYGVLFAAIGVVLTTRRDVT
jgi:ABC-type transport system involved in multi-copper enzyme maturation permease subunit